ncbi:MAG TPA: site-specific DNA-methyltransferase [Anaerohalosphaeraceae bacterium]|nr:site-specific DNA-methyltransferase [Anaerohalosphaeraceae bacterium]HRT50240.1 site-specific DNA-methyltransferase [Anaerohalosphaeraceae bacterium]HRT86239.1 site-specific DNA-methyltransferase [Anaerohalosphaeraceae bacterium]
MMAAIDKMDGQSANPHEELLALLRKHAPYIFSEDSVDVNRLAAALGKDTATEKERYGLSWAGKTDCFRHIQEPTTATLKPCREESVDFDTTENIFIEGDNLQVLKVLQKSYYGKIKMIYIDPPYNTGNDTFIYPDRFQESQDDYLRRIGDKDAEGNMTSDGFWRKNTRDSGHFHSNWLSMMYPRLFLAKNLLRPDGVIFVSIDDNEVHNLRMIMNEIFGEENFVASIIWQKKYAVSNDDPSIAPMHDYIIAYQRSEEFNRNLLPRSEKQLQRYSNADNDPRGPWSSDNYISNKSRTERPTLWYAIKHPKTGEDVWPDENAVWRYAKEKHLIMEKENRLYWGPDLSYKRPRLKRFLSEIQPGIVPSTWWPFQDVGHNDEGQKETALLLGKKVFSTPKPVRLMKRLLEIGSSEDCIVLDFFAGSGATAHSVMQLNEEDGGNRRFICVQLPEPCEQDSEAYKAGFKTVAEIGKERIRRAAAKIKKENEGKLDFATNTLDLGFKVFKLDQSNFKIWRSDVQDADTLKKQLSLFVDNVNPDAQQQDILYELILKSGLDLNAKVEAKKANRKQFFVVEGRLIICLEEKITEKLIEKILAEKPEKVLCLDRAFAGNDQLKTNTALQMEAEKIEFKVI